MSTKANTSKLSGASKKPSRMSRLWLSIALAAVFVMAIMGAQLINSQPAQGASSSKSSTQEIAESEGFCALAPVTLQQRVNGSSLIVEGQVVSSYSFWDEGRKNIYTSNLIKVYKVFQGSFAGSSLEVITEGGTVGDRKDVVTPSLQLSAGEMGVFLLEQSTISDPAKAQRSQPVFMTNSSVQGFIKYDLQNHTAWEPFRTYEGIESDVYTAVTGLTGRSYRVIAENTELANSYRQTEAAAPDATPTISSFSPNPVTAGTGAILTINGTNFGAVRGTGFVEFATGDSGGATFIQPPINDYVLWSNTQIQVKVPGSGNASTGQIRVTNSDPASATSASILTVTYSVINVNDGGFGKHGLHQNRDGLGGYTFQVSNNASGGMASNTPAVDSFLRAMNTWVCSTGVNFRKGTDTAVNTSAADNVNIVAFDNAQPLPGGVLARMTSRFSGCGPGTGLFDFYVLELDLIAARPGVFNWQFGPAAPSAAQFDFETVLLHEIGHGHQLGHNNNGTAASGSIMYFQIANGVAKRTLSATNDISGGNYTMSLSTSTDRCGLTRMTVLSCPTNTFNKVADFDGDGRTDVSVFRPSNGAWYLLRSTQGFTAVGFGANGDNPVPGDYDGDGKTDVAVFRVGTWYRLNSSNGAFVAQNFGIAGDIAVPGRYDTDSKTDLAVFRPSNGTWYVLRSTDGGLTAQQFGANGDLPIAGDFDGDGRTDFAVFRSAIGTWYIQQTTAGFTSLQFGSNGDMPAPGDFDGDNKTDIAVFRPSNGVWYLQRSQLGFTSVGWGLNGDQPSAGDYDGDNKTDVAVFRPSSGTFYILQSLSGSVRAEPFGLNGDISIPRSYAP